MIHLVNFSIFKISIILGTNMIVTVHCGTEASYVGTRGTCPLASEIQNIFGNFKPLYQLRMYMMTSWDLNVNVCQKTLNCAPNGVPTHDTPTMKSSIV